MTRATCQSVAIVLLMTPLLGGAASASSLHIGDTVRLALRRGPALTMTVQAIVPEGLVGTRGEYVPWIAIVSVTVLSSDTYRFRLLMYGAIIAVQALVYGHDGG